MAYEFNKKYNSLGDMLHLCLASGTLLYMYIYTHIYIYYVVLDSIKSNRPYL